MKKEIFWLNTVKAICMISVYILHSEVYYGINKISYGQILQPFYVNAFFFVNGYLFFRKYLQVVDTYNFVNLWKNFQNVVFRLIIPTIVFASIIFIPKLFFHDQEISILRYFYDVFGGISFWFTSTIAISQIILLCLLLSRKKTIWFYFGCSILLFMLSIYLNKIDSNPFPWYYKSGLGATLFLILGGIYQQYEKRFDKMLGKTIGFVLITIVYIGCVGYNILNNSFQYVIMSMSFNIEGLLVSLLGIIFIIFIGKILPNFKILGYIGRTSIVFYFFSGLLPASIGLFFQKIFPDKLYIITIIVALLSIGTGFLLTYIVVNYLPWLTDFRKLKK